MLKLQERGKPHHEMWLVKPHTTIGSANNCDFVLPSDQVAKIHIELLIKANKITLKDCDSNNPSFVNNKPVTNPYTLKHGDEIKIADVVLDIIDPKQKTVATAPIPTSATPVVKKKIKRKKSAAGQWYIVASGDWLEGQRFSITGTKVMGREASCDITIPGTHLSRQHATFKVTEKGLIVKDMDSSNGTYVNDKRIKQVLLQNGDEVRFDVLTFKVTGPPPANSDNKTVIRPASSDNQTVMRKALDPAAINKAKQAQAKSSTPDDKKWKTKPTSLGNRDPLENNYAKKKPDLLLYSFVSAIVIATLVYIFVL